MKSSVLIQIQGLREHVKKEIKNFINSVAALHNFAGVEAPDEQ